MLRSLKCAWCNWICLGCLPWSNSKMLPQHKNVQLFSTTSINQVFKRPVNWSNFIWHPHRNLPWKHLESTSLIYLWFRNDVASTDKVTIRQLLIVRWQPKFLALKERAYNCYNLINVFQKSFVTTSPVHTLSKRGNAILEREHRGNNNYFKFLLSPSIGLMPVANLISP